MRCRTCNHVYTPTRKDRTRPQCGYEPLQDKANRRSRRSVQRVKLENHVSVAVFIACVVIAIAALVTGQMLILGGLLAAIMGVCLLCYGFLGYFGNLSNGWLARGLSIGFGLPALAGGIGCWVWALNGGPVPPFPPRYRYDAIDISDLAPLTALVIIALASGVGQLINRWLARAEIRGQRQSGEQGLVFPIPYLARGPLMMVLVLLLPPMVLLVLSTLNRANTGIMLETGCGVPFVLSPLVTFSFHMLRHNSGHVVLARDAVLLRRLGRERRMRYEEILHIKDYAFGLPPDLVLRGRGKRLRIPRSVQNLPRLYAVIQQRRSAHRSPELPSFPYGIAVRKGSWLYGVSVVAVSHLAIG